ncbi:MAG TPA: hypothetical protein VEG65_06245 [Candidatus Bathyarchaeia archaeon]|nr:hypothetical protein [Candidatus Bathyarchaeia archaeon]
MRIENDEIPSFITRCAVNALQWEVNGLRYEQWAAERRQKDDRFVCWRDDILIPHLQRQFAALEVHEDGRLLGIRRDTEERIDQGAYDPELLESCLLAKCPGQGWRFALGCCRKQHTK